jgi:hypothetical protein
LRKTHWSSRISLESMNSTLTTSVMPLSHQIWHTTLFGSIKAICFPLYPFIKFCILAFSSESPIFPF